MVLMSPTKKESHLWNLIERSLYQSVHLGQLCWTIQSSANSRRKLQSRSHWKRVNKYLNIRHSIHVVSAIVSSTVKLLRSMRKSVRSYLERNVLSLTVKINVSMAKSQSRCFLLGGGMVALSQSKETVAMWQWHRLSQEIVSQAMGSPCKIELQLVKISRQRQAPTVN